MSDLEALYIFLNKPVSSEMVKYLVSTTSSIIQIQKPTNSIEEAPSLDIFINNLISHSHVQTTTLMTTLIYLNKLKNVIPSNSIGMYTTHHRIFLGSLLLSAKFTNDSSPMNKHWSLYTNGLLSLKEVNALEIEIIKYIGWDNLNFTNYDLVNSLSYFLAPIKRNLRLKHEQSINNNLRMITSNSNSDLRSAIPSSSTNSSIPSLISASSSSSTIATSYSTQSVISRNDSIPSITSVSPSPPTSPKHSYSSNIEIQLRPLKLKPKSNNISSKETDNKINNIPLMQIHSNLKYSKKSVNLSSSQKNKTSILTV